MGRGHAVAHVLAFKVDLTVEHTELLGHGFLLSAVGMVWITSHSSGSSTAMKIQLDVSSVYGWKGRSGVEVTGFDGEDAPLGGTDREHRAGIAASICCRVAAGRAS
ncbi:MAG: hypothetical protein ACRDTA_23870 [Pseudonocardiaceae bacterium]